MNSLRAVITLLIARLIINLGRRFTYPFNNAISRELAVPLSSVQTVVGLQVGIGLLSPAFGGLAERYGRKRVMLAALALMGVAALIGTVISEFFGFTIALLLFGIAKMLFDPAAIAYVGDRVPYANRGRALGLLELSWAGALGATALIGWILEAGSLRGVFITFGIAVSVVFILIAVLIPPDHPAQSDNRRDSVLNPITALRLLLRYPAARAALIFGLSISVANEIFFINYSVWMETSFRLSATQLGLITIVIALAELCGELLVTGIVDRVGKRRLALIGAIGAGLMYAIAPFLQFDLILALIGLFLMFLAVETGIVASIPLYTEVVPESRSLMISAMIGITSAGRMCGAILGGNLYRVGLSFGVLGVIAALIGIIGAAILWRGVKLR
ncbi:MAG: MFS transporter [Anaerolineae bacterium]|jgi:predicted MFS family arabinose efflux permease|nr:MFS transporter [Anaerolineae bacterium]